MVVTQGGGGNKAALSVNRQSAPSGAVVLAGVANAEAGTEVTFVSPAGTSRTTVVNELGVARATVEVTGDGEVAIRAVGTNPDGTPFDLSAGVELSPQVGALENPLYALLVCVFALSITLIYIGRRRREADQAEVA
jgi:hypothetical protein